MRIAVVAAMSLFGCAQFLDLDDYDDAPTGMRGQSAASSGAGGEAASSSSAGGARPTCPAVTLGPELVELDGYCMDATEVTEGHYSDWLATSPSTGNQPPFCAGNTTFWNSGSLPLIGGTLPVVRVDWCDALAFCTAAGKRLCGKIGGGDLLYVDQGPIATPESEWYQACTNAGATEFPYGDTYDPLLCNGLDARGEALVPVGDLVGCRTHSGIVDLSGNAYEWEDACDGKTGGTDRCQRRGGSYLSPAGNMPCDGNDSIDFTRDDDSGETTGFRCCADLE